ncbi:COP23 domain-containing protein [Anabaena azotica]|uniref:Uncharacterized protein n=1 Tax=Anabaena azotica FACHB-119 TaxID=947527 RepID=A0ABR8DEE1_9NOST|nr:COP23 domain-containing protein [Anabaena azotica]MBD2504083.1 hypothetical protein [Anabaena azotica FACHB-119]
MASSQSPPSVCFVCDNSSNKINRILVTMTIKYFPISIVFIVFLVFCISGCAKENEAGASNQLGSATTSSSDDPQKSSNRIQFFCGTDTYKGQTVPATIVNNHEQNKPLTVIYWNPNNNSFGEKWTPQQRCEEVSKRFQTIFERDALKKITADEAQWITERKINVVCSVKVQEQGTSPRCEQDDLLFTLETKDDPNKVLEELIAFRADPTTNAPLTRGKNQPKSFAEGQRVYYDIGTILENKQKQDNSKSKSAF